ncbi:serine/threonine-protein phosphatase CPPED1 [Mixophyes fleayi]|uniref:serine/threonine-protein phosphatase CPPED1 n=1 Tax=Mixophyes fleayi TaxID=3061075 RepID=UPI003F4E4170
MSEDREVFLRARNRTFTSFREDVESEWKGPFYFIQGADPQFGLMKSWAIGDSDFGGDEWDQEFRLTEEAVEAINKLCPKPKFFVVCGDLVHAMPGIEWKEAQERDLKTALLKTNSEIPLVFVSGNHDIGNAPTLETVQTFCNNWGDDYFSFWVGGVFFLVLNSQLFFDGSKCPEQKEHQDKWLADQLALAKERQCKRAIIFQHIPLFLQDPDEENNYFNLEKASRQELLEVFHKAGVKAVFSGHYHRNAGGMYKDLDMVVTSAIGCQLGEDEHGVRAVVVTEDKIVHRYYSLDKLKNEGLDQDLMDLIMKK